MINKTNSLKISLLLILLLTTIISVSALDIFETASDDDLINFAFKSADTTPCEYISDDAKKIECYEIVEDRLYLDKSVVEVQKKYENASIMDKQLLSKAILADDVAFCSNIVDEKTRNECYKETNPEVFNQILPSKKIVKPIFIYSLLIIIIIILVFVFWDIEKRRKENFEKSHEQLIRYIKLEIKKGASDEDILANLKRVGWNDQAVKKGMKDAKRKK